MKKILIPIDGSEYSSRAIEKGKEIAEAFGSTIVLIHVSDLRFPVYPYESATLLDTGSTLNELIVSAVERSKELLQISKEALNYEEKKVETVSLEGDVPSAIIDFVNESDADLVIMGSQGINAGLQGLLLGSVTNKVVHNIKKPILVVR